MRNEYAVAIVVVIVGFFMFAPIVPVSIHVPCPQGQGDQTITWYNSLSCSLFGFGATYSAGDYSGCVGNFDFISSSC